MGGKRQELRANNFIFLSEQDKQIINALGESLRDKQEHTLVETYKEVIRIMNKPRLSIYRIKFCILVLYIRHHIKIDNRIKPKQRAWRTYLKLET